MLPLVMPWEVRKASSVLTSTSKIALPTPRTSYFASAIHQNPVGTSASFAAYHRQGCYRSLNDPLLPHGLLWHAGLAAARIFARFHDRGAARHRADRGCFSGCLSVRQCDP